MNRRAPLVICLLLASAVASGQSTKQPGPPATPGKGTSTWNAATAPPVPSPSANDSLLSLRVYGDSNRKSLPPYQPGPRRLDDPAYAVDVSAVMTHCSDGSLLITGLVIGGQLTPLENRCPATRGNDSVKQAPVCDASRWNCTTAPIN